MDATKIELVQSSFAKVVPIADKAAEIFYAKLFDRDPSLKSLFKGDMTQQGNKLMTMIGTAVNGLNNLDAIVPAVQNLGRNHVGYGVTESMYADVGAALIETLEVGLGDEFTEDTKAAWVEVYALLSDTMKTAAKEVEEEPGLTPYKVKLVQDSFLKVAPIADKAAEIFYNKLFELDPSLKSLFSDRYSELILISWPQSICVKQKVLNSIPTKMMVMIFFIKYTLLILLYFKHITIFSVIQL